MKQLLDWIVGAILLFLWGVAFLTLGLGAGMWLVPWAERVLVGAAFNIGGVWLAVPAAMLFLIPGLVIVILPVALGGALILLGPPAVMAAYRDKRQAERAKQAIREA